MVPAGADIVIVLGESKPLPELVIVGATTAKDGNAFHKRSTIETMNRLKANRYKLLLNENFICPPKNCRKASSAPASFSVLTCCSSSSSVILPAVLPADGTQTLSMSGTRCGACNDFLAVIR